MGFVTCQPDRVGSVPRMLRFLAALLIGSALGACSDDADTDDAARRTTTTEAALTGETSTTASADDEAPLDVDAVVAALGAAGLCADAVPGDPKTETLGSLVPTGVARCTTEARRSDVAIFVYPSQADATEAAAIAADFACSVDAGAEFGLLVAAGVIVQIDSTTGADEFGIAESDLDALAAAQAVLGGDVRTTEC